MLLAWDQFERVQPFLSAIPGKAISPEPSTATTSECRPLRLVVREMPLTPEVATEAKRYGRQLGLWGSKRLRELEEQMKLQHYFGGKWIAELPTGDGPVIVACADDLGDPTLDQQLAFLNPDERRRVVLHTPPRLFSDENEILTPFADEG